MDENTLKQSLELYKSQLSQVEQTLQAAGETADLLQLRDEMKQLISLTEDGLVSLMKSKMLTEIGGGQTTSHSAGRSSQLEDEYAAFQASIGDGQEKSDEGAQDGSSTSQSIVDQLQNIVGMKCRAPFLHEWGSKGYFNAIVTGVEETQSSDEVPKVTVMYCNPTSTKMLPCSFHLEGRCNFDREWCKYSHGNVVDVEDLKEFKEPNYNYLQMGMPCLVRYDDDLWYRAKVVDILDDHKFTVNFDNYNDTRTVDLEEILPLDASNNESDENSDDDDDYADRNQPIDRGPEEEGEELPVYLWKPPKTNEALGSWEAHTRESSEFGLPDSHQFYGNPQGSTFAQNTEGMPSSHFALDISSRPSIAHHQNVKIPIFTQDDHMMQTSTCAIGNQIGRRPALLPTPDMNVASGTNDTKSQIPSSPQSARASSQSARAASHASNNGNSATYSKDQYSYGAPTVLPTPKMNITDGFSNTKSQNHSPQTARAASHSSNSANNSKDQYRYGQPTVLPTPKMNVTDVSSKPKCQNHSPHSAKATSHASNGKNVNNSKDHYRYSAPTALPESARVWINPNLQKQAPKPASIHESIWKKYSRKRKPGPFDVTNPLKRKIPESGQGNDTSDTQNSDKSFEENPDADAQDATMPKKKRRRPKNPYSRGLHSKWTPKTASKFQSCPFPTCNIQSRRMKWHVGIEHLNPAFDRIDAYQNPRHHIARRDGLEWLAKKILGPKASISDLVPLLNRSNIIHNNSVLSDKDIANMESMCRAMNWERPPAFTLHPINSPSVLLFWRCLLNLAMMLKPEDHQRFMKETTTNLLKQYYSENSTTEAKDVVNRPVSVEQKANTTSSQPNVALLGRNDINSRLENIRKLIAQHADVDKVQIPNFKSIGAVGQQKSPDIKSSTTLGPRKASDFHSPANSGNQTLPDVKRSVPVGYQRTPNFQSVASSGNHTIHGNKNNLASDSPKTPSIQSITTSGKHTLPDIQRNEAVGRQRAPNFQSVESQGNKRMTDVRRNVAVSNQMTTDFQRVPSLHKQRASDFQSIAALENRKATDSNTISIFGNNQGTPDFQSFSASGIKKTPDSTSSDIFRSNQQTHDSMHFAAFSSNQQSPDIRSFAAFGSNQEAHDFQSIAALSNKMSPSSMSSAAFSSKQESPDSMSFTAFGSNQQSPDSQNIQLFSNQPTTDAKNIQQFSRHEQAYAFMRRVQALNRNQRAPGPKKNASVNSNQQMSDFNKGVALNSIQPPPEFKRMEPLISLQQSPDLMRTSALRGNQEIPTFERIAASNSTQQSPDFKSIAVSTNQQTSDFKSTAAQSNQNSEVSSTQGPPEEMMSSLGRWRDGSDSKKTASGHQKAAAASMSSILLENVDCVFDSYLNVEEMCQILFKRKSWSFGRQPLKTIFKTRIMREVEPKHTVAVVGGVMIFDDPSCYPKKSHVDPTWNVAFGVHPRHAPFLTEEQLSRLAKILQGREIRALGTIGFDYTEQKTYWDFQEEVFVNLLGLSEPDRPIIIHVKGVEGDVLGSSVHQKCFTKVKEKCSKQQKIQLHSFSGTAEDVGMWTTEFPNCYFGFTWNVELFNEIQKSAIRSVPRDKILIETGILDRSASLPRTAIKRPTQLGDLAALIAEIRGEKFDEFLKQIVENGQRLHGTRIVKKKSR